MAQLGLHVFNPGWNDGGVRTESGNALASGKTIHSASFMDCTLKIYGTSETMTMPVQVCTKVWDVKQAIAAAAMIYPEDLTFVIKQGCTWKVQLDSQEIARNVTIKGLKSFTPRPCEWPHPIVFIGAGYNGIKHSLLWEHDGYRNYTMFEKYDRVGGHAWLVQANKTSKLQTELGAFHVWFGTEWGRGNERLSFPSDWNTWPKKDEVIAHIQHAAERYGILPHINFRKRVTQMDIVGGTKDHDRHYVLTVDPMDGNGEPCKVTASALYHFPGAYFTARVVNYPGEEHFGGRIGYGMSDDIPYDHLEGNRVAILGNGAFAVENVRTACEFGASMVYLITRRKNLAAPRMACWFCHQAIVPVPAAMLLNIMKPMYMQCGMDDPWDYHSVFGTKERDRATIISNSRFGIGDVTFLAVAAGRCEYILESMPLIKRCTHHALHMNTGRVLQDVTVIVKALGLLADFEADRFHKLKEMVGTWPSGDYRRVLFVDPLGMNAANFSSFSAGPGSYAASVSWKHLICHPQEHKRLVDQGVTEMLPRTKATDEKPAHQYDAKHALTSGMLVDGNLPRVLQRLAGMDDYFHQLYWAVNPLDQFFAECKNSWDQYQQEWKQAGFQCPYVPYPYTKDMVAGWFEAYSKSVGPVSLEAKEQGQQAAAQAEAGGPPQFEVQGSREWWLENCGKCQSV